MKPTPEKQKTTRLATLLLLLSLIPCAQAQYEIVDAPIMPIPGGRGTQSISAPTESYLSPEDRSFLDGLGLTPAPRSGDSEPVSRTETPAASPAAPQERSTTMLQYTEAAVRNTEMEPDAVKLLLAIQSGDVNIVDSVLDGGKVGLNEPIALFTSPYRYGKWNGSLSGKSVVVWPLAGQKMERKCESKDFAGNYSTLVPYAFSWSGVDRVDRIMVWGGNPPVLFGTPLMFASRIGNTFMVRHLLEKGANPNILIEAEVLRGGVSRPWMFALGDAYRCSDAVKAEKIARLLVEAGALLPPADSTGRNGLWDAMIARSPLMLDMAIRQGCDVNGDDHTGKTVADWCAQEANDPSARAFLKVLEERGAKLPEPAAPQPVVVPQPVAPRPVVVPQPVSPQPVVEPQPVDPQSSRAPFGAPATGLGAETGRREDHSAEIASLESELAWLHVQSGLPEGRTMGYNPAAGTGNGSSSLWEFDLAVQRQITAEMQRSLDAEREVNEIRRRDEALRDQALQLELDRVELSAECAYQTWFKSTVDGEWVTTSKRAARNTGAKYIDRETLQHGINAGLYE